MEQQRRIKPGGLETLRWYAAAAIIVYHVEKVPDRLPSNGVMSVVQFLNFGVPLFSTSSRRSACGTAISGSSPPAAR